MNTCVVDESAQNVEDGDGGMEVRKMKRMRERQEDETAVCVLR